MDSDTVRPNLFQTLALALALALAPTNSKEFRTEMEHELWHRENDKSSLSTRKTERGIRSEVLIYCSYLVYGFQVWSVVSRLLHEGVIR